MSEKPPSTLGIVLRYFTGGPRAVFDPKWKSGCRRSTLSLLGFLLAMFAVIIVLQAIFTPWGRSLTGGPTLTGRWLGEISQPGDRARPVYIRIEGLIWGADDSGCLRNCDLQGIGRVCVGSTRIQEYTFDGEVQGRRASSFQIDMRKAEDSPYGWRLGDLRGAWAGGDILQLGGEWISDPPRREVRIVMDSAGNTVMDPPPQPEKRIPVAFTLRRGREHDFLDACK